MSKPKLQWRYEGTGGGCTAFVAKRDGFRYIVTAHDDPCVPTPTEKAALGVYRDDDGDEILVSEHTNSLAATIAAEYWAPPTLRDWVNRRKHEHADRWRGVFNQSAQGTNALLDCPEDSVCGQLIIKVLVAGEALLAAMQAEQTARDRVITAIRSECNVIYFG
jgi:hypothetical protein